MRQWLYMDIKTFATYAVWFLIYSFIGWIYESTLRSFLHRRWYNSGFLNGPYIPIYGFGAILDIFFLKDLSDPLQIFLYSGIIDCLLEYLTSWGMEKLFHARWWDYSNKFLNINGRICLLGFVAFGSFATVIVLFFHPWLQAHTTDLMDTAQIVSLSSFGAIVLSADTWITVSGMKGFQEKVEELTLALENAKSRVSEQISERFDSLPGMDRVREIKLSLQEKRLLRAFPSLRFRNMKYTAEQIIQMIRDNYRSPF